MQASFGNFIGVHLIASWTTARDAVGTRVLCTRALLRKSSQISWWKYRDTFLLFSQQVDHCIQLKLSLIILPIKYALIGKIIDKNQLMTLLLKVEYQNLKNKFSLTVYLDIIFIECCYEGKSNIPMVQRSTDENSLSRMQLVKLGLCALSLSSVISISISFFAFCEAPTVLTFVQNVLCTWSLSGHFFSFSPGLSSSLLFYKGKFVLFLVCGPFVYQKAKHIHIFCPSQKLFKVKSVELLNLYLLLWR